MEWSSRGQLARTCGLTGLVAAVALAAGCGGQGKTQQTKSASVPRSSEPRTAHESAAAARLIAKADAICKRLNNKLAATASTGSEARQLARSAPRHAAQERRAVAELRTLTPPASLAADWTQMIAYRQTLLEELVELARYAKANNARAIQSLGASKKRVHQKLKELARRDGFKDCSIIGVSVGIGPPFGPPRSTHRPGGHV